MSSHTIRGHELNYSYVFSYGGSRQPIVPALWKAGACEGAVPRLPRAERNGAAF